MAAMMFLQEAFSLPTWEGFGTHLWVATHSLRSPAVIDKAKATVSTFQRAAKFKIQIFKILLEVQLTTASEMIVNISNYNAISCS